METIQIGKVTVTVTRPQLTEEQKKQRETNIKNALIGFAKLGGNKNDISNGN